MQPYIFPYIGYYQLIAAVDEFILYDNIKYTKKGWINRNRILKNGSDVMFTLPLKKGSDYLLVCERKLAADFSRVKMLNQIKGAYQQAPYFAQTFPLIERVINYEDPNLFNFLYHSIMEICKHLGIETRVVVSSSIEIDHSLKGQDKVIALCMATGARTYVNAIGGMELYSKEVFRASGIDLKFIKAKPFTYRQSGDEFIPWLSIIDVMMFNPLDVIRDCIESNYEMI